MWFWAPMIAAWVLSGCAGMYTDWHFFMHYKTPQPKAPLQKLPDSSEVDL
jgi:hypothetical protein